jgi:hypothetical protein
MTAESNRRATAFLLETRRLKAVKFVRLEFVLGEREHPARPFRHPAGTIVNYAGWKPAIASKDAHAPYHWRRDNFLDRATLCYDRGTGQRPVFQIRTMPAAVWHTLRLQQHRGASP